MIAPTNVSCAKPSTGIALPPTSSDTSSARADAATANGRGRRRPGRRPRRSSTAASRRRGACVAGGKRASERSECERWWLRSWEWLLRFGPARCRPLTHSYERPIRQRTPASKNFSELKARRLDAQLLSGPPARSPEAVVERLLAVQAQDAPRRAAHRAQPLDRSARGRCRRRADRAPVAGGHVAEPRHAAPRRRRRLLVAAPAHYPADRGDEPAPPAPRRCERRAGRRAVSTS